MDKRRDPFLDFNQKYRDLMEEFEQEESKKGGWQSGEEFVKLGDAVGVNVEAERSRGKSDKAILAMVSEKIAEAVRRK